MKGSGENVDGNRGSYRPRLQKLDEESRAMLARFQTGENPLVHPDCDVADFSGSEFPRDSLMAIRDFDLDSTERQELITYLLGCWYLDQVDGAWAYVPMLVEQPALYLSFGVGIETKQGSMINVAESAREIIEGHDLGFKEAIYTANVRVENQG